MTTAQKIIKYVAAGFAIFLAFSIVISILQVSISVIGGLAGWNKDVISDENDFEKAIIKNIDIDMSVGTLTIVSGDDFMVTAKNVSSDYKCLVKDTTLKIDSSGWSFSPFGNQSVNSKITVTIPENADFDDVNIDFGAGEMKLNDLIVNGSLKIDCGVGEVSLDNVTVNDSKIDLGVGEISLTGTMSGSNKIENGIGEISLNLAGNPDNYDIDKDHGLGESKVHDNTNGKYDNDTSPSGTISTDIGIGETDITFK